MPRFRPSSEHGTVHFSIHVPTGLHQELKRLAKIDDCSLSCLCNEILEFHVDHIDPVSLTGKLDKILQILEGYDFTEQ